MTSPRTRRTPRKKPTQARSRETVDAIVTAAARILEESGYARTNVNRVAELAGVSVGSLYQYFPSKEALVTEVARRLSAELISTFQDDIGSLVRLDMRGTIHGVVARAVRALRTSPRLRAVILEELPQHLFDSLEFDAMFAEAVRAYLVFHAPQVRPTNLDVAVAIVMSSVEAAAKATAERGDAEEVVIEELSELVYRYLAK